MRKSNSCLLRRLFIILVAGGLTIVHAAQFQNPIQAAKDAYNKAKQDAQQQQQQQRQQPGQQPAPSKPDQPTNTPSAQPSQAQSGSAATDVDCCTPEAMKKIAASIGFVDIVGVKLGMTPAEALAAVKAYNPSLKIENLTARLEHPSGPLGNFVRVPYTINAYSANYRTDLGPVEWIAMQFTLPPGPPLLAKVQRYSGFVVGQPVMAANLLQSLRKKYGQDNVAVAGDSIGWVYDSNGKLLTRVSSPQAVCAGDGYANGVPGGQAVPHPPPGESGASVSLTSTSDTQRGQETKPVCAPLVWVVAHGVGERVAPNYQQTEMTVSMESGGLAYMSIVATHNWLQAEADAKIKQQNDAAAGRSAPKL
jgi:hypothetical protein